MIAALEFSEEVAALAEFVMGVPPPFPGRGVGLSGELRGESGIADNMANTAVDELLARTDRSGEKLTEAWNELGLSREDVAALPVATLAQLASRNGLPAWAQDVASTELLHYSLIAPNEAYQLFGFGTSGPSVNDFRTQTIQLYVAWQDTKREVLRMGGNPTVQLLALGSHDGAMTAAISHGDLDTASHVGVNAHGEGVKVQGEREALRQAAIEDQEQSNLPILLGNEKKWPASFAYRKSCWRDYRHDHTAICTARHRRSASGADQPPISRTH